MIITNMATTLRHDELASEIRSEIYHRNISKVRNRAIKLTSGEIALVYEGNINEEFLWLVDPDTIENTAHFSETVMDELRWVQPDFSMFTDNRYLVNKAGTKIAGRPNLIVEVWSAGNPALERERKFILYSSSPVTEHWYIEQDNNIVSCYLGKERLGDQTLEKVLKTREGMNIDLTHLAL